MVLLKGVCVLGTPGDEGRDLRIELGMVPLDELIRELQGRHRRMLFVGVDVEDSVQLYKSGYMTDAVGLAEYAARKLLSILVEGDDGLEDRDGA
jgi:hypothetical protein